MTIPQHQVRLDGDPGPFHATLLMDRCADGLEEVRLILHADAPHPLPPLALRWAYPAVDIQSRWDTAAGWSRGNRVNWADGMTSKATSQAPVVCLYSLSGLNRLTFALSDALNPVTLRAGIHEETAVFDCALEMFRDPGPPVSDYTATLRLDTRPVPYYEALDDVQAWWATLPGYVPSPVPAATREPMYSTWYSFHQQLTPDGIEAQCRLAKDIGCGAVIVDDGWQTADGGRGYAYCGDWEVSPARIPDMAAHVARVHALGLKYLLWYSVPFVGIHSRAWTRFRDRFLSVVDMTGQVGVLDPRFPEVREYLLTTYERALRDWDLDGLKLDFVDSFPVPQEDQYGGGRDCDSVPDAVDRLLSDAMGRLRAIKPDVMIEFRQSYVGPLMRKYGNMFRAGDCPDDPLGNRLRTLDIRLLCGDTAAHADMLMWHPDETTENAALQIINVLFAVPQISVLLDRLPPEHTLMLRWWLAWWREHRAVLLGGKLMPLHPEMMYPVVIAAGPRKKIVAAYADLVISPGNDLTDELWLVNGTQSDRLVLELAQDYGTRLLSVRDCRGRPVREEKVRLGAGLCVLPVPPSGTACVRLH